jgi:hypothetical protein
MCLQFEIFRFADDSPNLRAVRIYDWLKYGHKKTPKVPKGEEAV